MRTLSCFRCASRRCVSRLSRAVLIAGALLSLTGLSQRALAFQDPRPRNVRATESCGAARDLVVQALEEMGPKSAPAQLDDSLQLLKRANDLCSESGDAWYYRSLVEARLQHKPKADYALTQARKFNSLALEDEVNPFVLSTPDARGVGDGRSTPKDKAPASIPSTPAQKWAIVIGISQFRDQGIRSLNYTTKDADAFVSALQDPAIGQFAADHVVELTDSQATAKNIKSAINAIARQAAPNDLVVVYVATHGSPRSLDSVSGVNYLVTYDTEMFANGVLDEDAMYATAFPMVELANIVSTRMKSLRTLIVLDTCFSGGSFTAQGVAAKMPSKAASPTPQMLEKMGAGTGRIVMAASQADEESLESQALGHGFFTYYLLQALKEGGGQKTLTQIFATVSEKVSQQASQSGSHQHPVMYRSTPTADFSLGTAASVASNEPVVSSPARGSE